MWNPRKYRIIQIKIAGIRYISHDKKITFLKFVNDKQEYFRHRLFNPNVKMVVNITKNENVTTNSLYVSTSSLKGNQKFINTIKKFPITLKKRIFNPLFLWFKFFFNWKINFLIIKKIINEIFGFF